MSTRRRRPGSPAVAAAVVALVAVGVALAFFAAGPGLAAQAFPEFTAPVVDAAGVVPDQIESQVSAALEDYRRRSGNQVAVAVVRTTGRRSLEDYTIDLARDWGVGEKGNDNGVLLLIATEDRKLRIEVGRGLEGTLTDLQSGRIIRQRLVPRLREGDFGGAVTQGTAAIRQELGDTEVGPLPPVAEEDPGSEGGGSAWSLLLLLPVVGLALLGSGRRRRRFGGGFGAPIFWGGGWGGGGFGGGHYGSFGGGGGGGFGGGGGGGFGGGGASGGW